MVAEAFAKHFQRCPESIRLFGSDYDVSTVEIVKHQHSPLYERVYALLLASPYCPKRHTARWRAISGKKVAQSDPYSSEQNQKAYLTDPKLSLPYVC